MSEQELCEVLKELGVLEVILSTRGEIPGIEFSGKDTEGHFKITMENSDFAENGL